MGLFSSALIDVAETANIAVASSSTKRRLPVGWCPALAGSVFGRPLTAERNGSQVNGINNGNLKYDDCVMSFWFVSAETVGQSIDHITAFSECLLGKITEKLAYFAKLVNKTLPVVIHDENRQFFVMLQEFDKKSAALKG